MKKKLLLCLSLLLFMFGKAQIQDLTELAAGRFLDFQPIYDKKEKLYGYFVLYGGDRSDRMHNKFEYVILDKNLNKVANNQFIAENTVKKYIVMKKKDKFVMLPIPTFYGFYSDIILGSIMYPETKQLDIKSNVVSTRQYKCYKDNAFYECPENKSFRENKRDRRKEKREKGYVYDSDTTLLDDGYYFVTDSEDWNEWKTHNKNNRMMVFNQNQEKLWEIKYNQAADKKNYEKYQTLALDSSAVYFVHRTQQKKEIKNELVAFNLKDGSVKIRKEITEIGDKALQKDKTRKDYGDKIFLVGENVKEIDATKQGYYRITIDKKTNQANIDTFSWKDAAKYAKIDEKGDVGRGYKLEQRDVYILGDGSTGILTEKFKLVWNYFTRTYVPRATDIVYITTDSQFKIKDINILEKEKNKGYAYPSDYLFSQYLNNDKNVAFFYKNYQKDNATKNKRWMLFVNTVVNDRYKQDKIPISSKEDKFEIFPFPAKEGYILLREFNEKDKYNQIRLEKLNY